MQISRRKLKQRHRRERRKHPKNWCLVYVLREASGLPARYVGQTRLHPSERLRWHLKGLRDRQAAGQKLTRLMEWMASLPVAPIIEVIDENGIWDISEAVWIDRLRAAGEPLFNVLSVVPSGAGPCLKWNKPLGDL